MLAVADQVNPLSQGPQTIFLINQVSGRGHLDLYARLYSAALLELGYRVVLIEQSDSGTRRWLEVSGIPGREGFVAFTRDGLRMASWSDRCSAIDAGPKKGQCDSPIGENLSSFANPSQMAAAAAVWQPHAFPPPSLLSRAMNIWRKEGSHGIAIRLRNRAAARVAPFSRQLDWSLFSRRLRATANLARSSARAATRFAGKAVRFVGRRWISPRIQRAIRGDLYLSGFDFCAVVEEIQLAQAQIGVRPDLVFFLYLDMMNEDRRGCRYLEENLGAPWAGILFHPRLTQRVGSRTETYFHCRNARGATFLNPHFLRAYRRRFPRHVYCDVPDISAAARPIGPTALEQELRRRAGDRKIVLLVGSIGAHKGALDLIEAVRIADPKRFFFAIVGEVFWQSFGDKAAALRAVYQAPPENLFVSEGYIKEESELDAIIAASDIVFAVYRDFRDSSNSLTKASLMEKPILVSDEYLMGERVRRYRIGATVTPGDIDGIVAAIEKLSRKPTSEFGFAQFRRDQSIENLKKTLTETLPLWIEGATHKGANVTS